MPVISRFFGIVIYMYWRDHTPAHLYAKYQNQEVTVEVLSGIVQGQMGKRAITLIQEWRQLHLAELAEDGELAREKKALHRISPLE